MPNKIVQSISPILPVHNVRRAMDYYQQLGFKGTPYREGDSYAFVRRDGLELHLRQAEDLVENRNPCGVYFYLAQGTAAALEAEFRAVGARILYPLAPREWKMNEFVLSDPDGNLLRFGEDFPST